MYTAFIRFLRRQGSYRIWLAVIAILALAIDAPTLSFAGSLPPHQPDEPDVAEIIVTDTRVTDFFVLNGTAFYARCEGDVGNYTSVLKKQQVDTPSTNQQLLSLPDCYRFRMLQADPTAVYYNNEPAHTIERRMLQDLSYVTVLSNYVSGTAPAAMALADGYVYWAAADSTIRRVSIYGGATELVVPATDGEPNDLTIDDYYIWFGTTNGIFKMARSCTVPCSPVEQGSYLRVKKLHSATTGTLPGEVSIFWVKLGVLGNPDEVHSWDGNIPGSSGISHTIHRVATLGTIDAVMATDDHVWWLERDGTSNSGQLRRIGRGVAENPVNGPFSERMDENVLPQLNWMPGRLQLFNEDLYYRSNGITRINQNSPPLLWDFDIQHIEVTQGQQNLESDGWQVANKRTFVRVYGQQVLGNDLAFPEAHLEGLRDGTPMPGSPLQPIISPSLLQTGVAFDRSDIDTTWLFELPPEWTVPDEVLLKATIDPRRLYDDNLAGASMQDYVTFYNQVPVCLVAVKVRQHGPTARHTDPEYVHLTSQMLDMSPTDELGLYHYSTRIEEGIWPFDSAYELPEDKSKILKNLWWHNAWSDDPDSCDGDSGEGRSHYVGLIHHQTDSGTALGRAYSEAGTSELWVKFPTVGGTTQGWPVNQRSAVLAHETNHNYGRQHVNCGGGLSGPDPNYPGDPCQLAQLPGDSGIYWGFEPRTLTPISPTMAADVMTYQGTEWTSRYTWMHMFNQLYPTANPPEANATAPEAVLVLIAGEINLLDPQRSKLDYAWVMDTTQMGASMQRKWQQLAVPALEPDAPELVDYTIQYLDSRGVVLATHPVEPIPTDEPTDALAPMLFGLSTPVPAGTVAQIRLRANTTQIDLLEFGRNAPELVVFEPVTGANVDQTLVVRWESYDRDGDIPRFMVQYRAAEGEPWQSLAADLIGSSEVAQYEISIDSSQLPGGSTNTALVRVVASDGYNTTSVISRPFTVRRRAPQAVISWPPAGYWLEPGKMITLEGWGTDAEDGFLDGSRLAWTLDGSSLGTGKSKQVRGLAPGSHTVRLTARDSNNQQNTAEVTFYVSPLAIAGGRARLDGRCNDPVYAGSTLVMMEPYADGSQARVVLARDSDYLWACFSGLKNQGPSSPGAFAGVRLDGNFSQDPLAQPSDYGFYVGQDGVPFTRQGDGAGGFNGTTPSYVDYALSAFTRTNPGGTTWNAELRIESWTAGVTHHMGAMLGHYWVNTQGDDYVWPYSAVWNSPATWAEGYFDSTPMITSLSPVSATLPAASGIWLEVHGENFKSTDHVQWGGSDLSTYYDSPSLLYGIVPVASQTAGEHTVTVERNNSAIESNPLPFTVYNTVPPINGPYPPTLIQGSADNDFQIYAPDATLGAQIFVDGQPVTTWYQGLGWITGYLTEEQMRLPGVRTVTLRNAAPVTKMSNGVTLTVTPCGLTGDFNYDLVIDVADIVSIADHWGEVAPPYDLDGSGRVTVKDIMAVAAGFGDSCP